jgi:cytoskeleton protein RodZ
MNNETTTNSMNTEKKSVTYGAKLKAAREAMGLGQKALAAQLRLGERIIEMLESGHYASDVPTTFMRGYIRSYSKLLQMPESEIIAALEPVKPAPATQETLLTCKQPADLTSSNYFMQFSTYAIVATLASMIGLWWYNHAPSQTVIAQSQSLALPDTQKPIDDKQVATLNSSTTSIPNPATSAASGKTEATETNTTTTASASTPSPETKLASTEERPHPVTRSAVEEDDDSSDDESNQTE